MIEAVLWHLKLATSYLSEMGKGFGEGDLFILFLSFF